MVPEDQSTAISPIFCVGELSKIGVKVVPLLFVCHKPPDAYPT